MQYNSINNTDTTLKDGSDKTIPRVIMYNCKTKNTKGIHQNILDNLTHNRL